MDNVFILPENTAFPAACLVFEQEAPSRLYFSHGKKNAHCEKSRNLLYCGGKIFSFRPLFLPRLRGGPWITKGADSPCPLSPGKPLCSRL